MVTSCPLHTFSGHFQLQLEVALPASLSLPRHRVLVVRMETCSLNSSFFGTEGEPNPFSHSRGPGRHQVWPGQYRSPPDWSPCFCPCTWQLEGSCENVSQTTELLCSRPSRAPRLTQSKPQGVSGSLDCPVPTGPRFPPPLPHSPPQDPPTSASLPFPQCVQHTGHASAVRLSTCFSLCLECCSLSFSSPYPDDALH